MTAGLAMAWGFLMGAAWQSWCQQNRRARRMGPPRGSYGLPADHDWRRSFTHENTRRPEGPPPLKLRREVGR
jgi:hypothetical protein